MALRLLSQSKNGLPISQFKQLKACVKILSARFKDEFIDEDGMFVYYTLFHFR